MSDTPRPDDLAGSVVGSYRITDRLGQGGMGAVFRARHELIGKPAAIKVLRSELCRSAEIVDRLFKEARAASAIHHPGIVEVFDFGYHADGRAYLVMELLDGEPLAARLARTGCDPHTAAVIARGIASVLAAAHAQGIVHRDLKPDNVFLVPDPDVPGGERPKILDFGIAKLADDGGRRTARTQTGALIGTPSYMAPEQARAAGAIDHRADLYSLGCVLYELLTGAPPFVAEGAGEVIAMHLFTEPEPPSARRPGIAPALDAITLRLLAKEPEARYQHAGEVVDALTAAIALTERMPARAEPARTPLHVEAAPTRPRGRGLRAALVTGVVTLGVAAAVVAFIVVRRERTAATVATAPEPAPGPAPTPAPPAPGPAPTPTPAPTVVAAADISYHLQIRPPAAAAAATVEVDGAPVALSTKGFFTAAPRPDPRQVVVRASGYADARFTLAGDADDSREVVLARVGKSPTREPADPPTGNKRTGPSVQAGGDATAAERPAAGTGSAATVTTGSGRYYIDLDDDDDK
jgi:tRNA A-37 threonylcarbamoyl transferase component Bud32